jgi:hypothetical protein
MMAAGCEDEDEDASGCCGCCAAGTGRELVAGEVANNGEAGAMGNDWLYGLLLMRSTGTDGLDGPGDGDGGNVVDDDAEGS